MTTVAQTTDSDGTEFKINMIRDGWEFQMSRTDKDPFGCSCWKSLNNLLKHIQAVHNRIVFKQLFMQVYDLKRRFDTVKLKDPKCH